MSVVAIAIPEAIEALQSAKSDLDIARRQEMIANAVFMEAGRTARISGVSIANIAEATGLSRQQAHRLFGKPKIDGA